VQQPVGPGPVIIPPPTPVRVSGLLAVLQGVGVLVLAVLILVSGLRNSAAIGQLLAQFAYYVVLAAAVAFCGSALLRGRRWGRTPVIVLQIVLGAVGYWLAVPSGHPVQGFALILLAIVTGGLLLTGPANDWIKRFPPMFGGPEES
jgi:hypothetical protein